MHKKKPRRVGGGFWVVLFLLGLSLVLYPTLSDWYYRQEFDGQIHAFETERSALSSEEVQQRLSLAEAYNRTLDPSRLADPFSEEEKAGVAAYAKMLEVHAMIGHIEVPVLGVKLPVYAGTSEEVLRYSAGHLEGTSLPVGGVSTHAVITAHRGLPSARLFRDLDRLQPGDLFFFHHLGGTLAYRVDQILTVEPTNFEPVLVEEGKDQMTLLTCTPYMVNSHRLLVRGTRVPYQEAVQEVDLPQKTASTPYRMLFWLAAAVFVGLALGVAVLLRRGRKRKSSV